MRVLKTIGSKVFAVVLSLMCFALVGDSYAQTFNDGPVQLQVKVRDIFTNFQASDEGVFGVGFKPDELTYKIWVRDAADLDGAGWVGGNCLLADFNPPGPSPDFNTVLFNYTYPGANVPQVFDLRLDAWEDESPDGILGFNCPGSRCAYETNFCCANLPFGGCAFRTSDQDRCNANPFKTGMAYRTGNPCEWYDWGYVSGSCPGNKYTPKIQSFWRYARGTACNDAIDLGTLTSGTTLSHFNSNICYTNNFPSSPGKDVFYRFTINSAMGVNISLCGAQGAQFDSYLYLLDPSCGIEASDNNGCGNQSEIVTSICAPGTYYVVVDGANAGAQGTFTLNITDDPSLTFSAAITPTPISCNGASDGAATVSVSGGFPPYSYAWSVGSTATTVSNLSPGSYDVTVTDNDGCSTIATTTIIEPPVLNATAVATDVSCGGAIDGTATVTASGGTPGAAPAPNNYAYEWSSIPVQTSNQAIFLPAGNYTVTVTDDNGCTTTASAAINTPVTVVANTISVNDVTCFNAADGSIDIDVSGGVFPYSYSWSTGQTTQDIGNLGPGNYTVTITDGINCILQRSYTIIEPQLLTVAIDNVFDVSCNGDADGAIDIIANGGIQPYSYAWSNGSVTSDLINVAAGNYDVTVSDANLCEAVGNAAISEPGPITTSFTAADPSCFSIADGSIDLTVNGGTPAYTYTWSNGATTEDLNNLSDGTYSVLIVDDKGCFAFATQNLNEPAILDLQAIITSVACNSDATGAIDITISGGVTPYTFAWSNGANTEDLSNLTAGTYGLTITDMNSCEVIESYNITEPGALTVAPQNVQDVSCNGGSDGLLDISIGGGVTPYSFSWNTGATSEDLFGLTAGSFDLTVTDQNACTVTYSNTIDEPAALITSISNTNVNCFGGGNGTIDLTVVGGTSPYTFLWSNGATTEDPSNLSAGLYTVLVTDNEGCVAFDSISVTAPTNVQVQATFTEPTCNGLPNGNITLNINGGVTPYSFNWSNGTTTQDQSNVAAGLYEVTVTDANGCGSATSVTLTEPALMTVTVIGVTDALCSGSVNGNIDITTAGGTTPYTFLWTDGSTNEDLINISSGSYTVTATDAQGCLASASATINEPTPITTSTSPSAPSCFGSQNGSIDLTVSGGTTPYNFQWSNGATTEDVSNLPANSYAVLITDANGCVAFDSATLVTGSRIIASFMAQDVSCNGLADGAIDVTATGGVTPYNYAWSNGSTTEDLSNLSGGSFNVTITDQVGCADTLKVALIEPDVLDATTLTMPILCFGNDDGLAYTVASGGTQPYNYLWNTVPPQTDPVATNLSAGSYTLEITDGNGCGYTEQISITEAPELSLNATVTSENDCVDGENGEVILEAQGGTANYEYAVFTDLFQSSGTFSNLPSGDFGAIVLDANGCIATTEFTLEEPDGFEVIIDDAYYTTVGATSQLEATVSPTRNIAEWIWFPADFLDCIDCPNPNITPTEDIIYTVTAIDDNGCEENARVRVFVRDVFEVNTPNAFSPNGDGINDEYEVFDLGATETFNIKVFDRWGSMVFESNDINVRWDGTYKGEDVNVGVYVYLVTGTFISGGNYKETGSITLIR